MTRDELLASARALSPVKDEARNEYADYRDLMVAKVDRLLLARPDLDELIGPGNRARMQNNHRNHAEFIESVLRHYDPEVLVESVLWVFTTYRAHGFQPAYWPIQIAAWLEAMDDSLTPPACAAIAPLYGWLGDHCPDFTALTDSAV